MKKHVTGAKSAYPQTIIQMIYDKADSKESAVRDLIAAADGNKHLLDHLVAKGANAAIGEIVRNDNARIFQGSATADVTKPRISMVESPLISPIHKRRIISTTSALKLMAVVLPNGVRMANATRSDIQDAIDTYAPQAADMLHKAAYYRAVLARLPDGKKVSDAFDDKGLTALYEGTRISEDVISGKETPTKKAA